jgi:AcrR family transcriptional regulator
MPKDTFNHLKPEKKQRIIDATIKELSEQPFEHVNLSNIIRDAGIARGSFYQYFENKDDLYQYFSMYIGQKKSELLSDLFDLTHYMPFIERLKALFLPGFVFAKTYPELVSAGYNMTQSSLFRDSPIYQQAYQQGIDFFEMLIKIDQDKGTIRQDLEARYLAEMILFTMNQINKDFFIHPNRPMEDIEKQVNFTISILQKGITHHV